MKFRTRAIHVGNQRDPQTGAVVPPIHVASTYVQQEPAFGGSSITRRSGNPTRANLERDAASLESGVGALAFSSGMAATHSATMLLRSGDHIVAGVGYLRRHVPAAAPNRGSGRRRCQLGSEQPGSDVRSGRP